MASDTRASLTDLDNIAAKKQGRVIKLTGASMSLEWEKES